MVMRNAQARRYLREIRKDLPCTGRAKREIFGKINTMIGEAVQEEPELSYDMLVQRFGNPRQIASSYVDELDTPELLKKLRIRKKILVIVCATAAIILAIWIGVVVTATRAHYNSMNGYFEEYVVVDE